MEENENNKDFVRWLNNDLSSEELKKFKKSEKFSLYNRIAQESKELERPEFNEDKVFENIKAEILKTKKGKVKKLIPSWAYAVAASIVLIFSLNYFLNQKVSYATKYGEKLTITLPDNSEVILNSKSNISFNKRKWETNRSLTLNGEAFFKVEKGSKFTVETTEGSITVLGTKFNINEQNNFIEVKCFEGKVKVVSNEINKTILTKGKAYRVIDSSIEEWNFTKISPSWIEHESSFIKTPIKNVIKALENHYDIKIINDKTILNESFTGSFTHNNINIALESVFKPLDISYKFTKKKTLVIKKYK